MSTEVVPFAPRLTREQQQRVLAGQAQVRRIAAQIAATMGWLMRASEVTHLDLIAEGDLELSHTVRLFDPTGETTFDDYAYPSIYGAMMNLLKAESRYQRLLRKGGEKAASAEHGSDDEPARPESWQEALDDYCDARVVGMLMGVAVADPESLAITRELHHDLRVAVAEEPPRERALLERSYLAEEPVERAGRALGMSRSSIKRRHGKALARVAARLKKHGVE
jgi:RNA polymerase sigma factor (sigma-70 family)